MGSMLENIQFNRCATSFLFNKCSDGNWTFFFLFISWIFILYWCFSVCYLGALESPKSVGMYRISFKLNQSIDFLKVKFVIEKQLLFRWTMDVCWWWVSGRLPRFWWCTACNQRKWCSPPNRHNVVWLGKLWWPKYTKCLYVNCPFH